MTPREVLRHVEGLGYRLALRPGGLRLTGATEPPQDLLGLIAENRDALLVLLESDAAAWAAHEASIAAGRITVFPESLAHLVHPSINRACAEDELTRRASMNRPLLIYQVR